MLKDETLIECVKRYPELYDPHHPRYSIIGKKTAIWSAVAREMGQTVSFCKMRWNSMRDAYRKSIYRNMMRLREGEEVKLYKYSKSLAFLKKFIKSTKEDHGSEDEVENVEDNTELLQKDIVTLERQKVKEETDKSDPEVHLEEYCPEVVSEYPNDLVPAVECQPAINTLDTFLACIGATLKSLPPYYASQAKADIFACVQKYELRAITENQGAHPSGNDGGLPVVSAMYSESAGIKLDPLDGLVL